MIRNNGCHLYVVIIDSIPLSASGTERDSLNLILAEWRGCDPALEDSNDSIAIGYDGLEYLPPELAIWGFSNPNISSITWQYGETIV